MESEREHYEVVGGSAEQPPSAQSLGHGAFLYDAAAERVLRTKLGAKGLRWTECSLAMLRHVIDGGLAALPEGVELPPAPSGAVT